VGKRVGKEKKIIGGSRRGDANSRTDKQVKIKWPVTSAVFSAHTG
jgi:hypothetical protein